MTRMTSDIENLQQLLQDGLASLVVQALTMIVIAVDHAYDERQARRCSRSCSSCRC